MQNSTDAASTTVKRHLRSGIPVWLRRGHAKLDCSPLDTNLVVDVAVVGAGVSGALVTDALLSAGQRVAVFDRRGPVQGSTPASTALLQFDLDQPLIHLSDKIGRDRAVRAYWRSATAVDSVRARIADLGIRCCFRERSSIYLPGNVLDVTDLKREAAARAAVGGRSRFLDGGELRRLTGMEGRGAVLSAGAGELDPVAFTVGLWRRALARGARIHAPTEIVDVDGTRRAVTLTTAGGLAIRAKHVVFATGYEFLKSVRPRGHKVISTWAMATRPQPRRLWPSRCLIWEAADPYLYLRTTLDGRAIVGGEDEDIADAERRDALTPKKIAAIRRKLARMLPDLDTEPAFTWAGCFGQSATGMPFIGPIPGVRGGYTTQGYGGNGLTFSMLAAQLLQRAILGLHDPDAAVFSSSRDRC